MTKKLFLYSTSLIFFFKSFNILYFADHDELVNIVNSYFCESCSSPVNENENRSENRNENGNGNGNGNGNNSNRIISAVTDKKQNPIAGKKAFDNAKNIPENVPSWESTIWPEIKRKIFATLETAQTSIIHRPRTFEFLGYDVLIDANGVPWILEVCLSVRV